MAMSKKGKIVLGILGGTIATSIGAYFLITKLKKGKKIEFDWVGRQLSSDGATIVAGVHMVGITDAADHFSVGDTVEVTLTSPSAKFPTIVGKHEVVGLYSDEGKSASMVRINVPMEKGQTASGFIKKI